MRCTEDREGEERAVRDAGGDLAYERGAVLVARGERQRVHPQHRRAVVRRVHQQQLARLWSELQEDESAAQHGHVSTE